jgi:hypothetical protein
MALAEAAGGSQTAVINTEHTLTTLTTSKTYVLEVNLTNMVNGDQLELRIKKKVRSGGTSALAWENYYANLQSAKIVVSIPVASPHEYIATLKQTAGTGRVFEWCVLSID